MLSQMPDHPDFTPWSTLERVPDTDYFIRERHSGYWMDYEAWYAVAWGEAKDTKEYTVPAFYTNGRDTKEGFTPGATERNRYLHGFIKWDGCCQWWPRDNLFHFDSPKDADRFGKLMRHFYTLGAERIAAWDGD